MVVQSSKFIDQKSTVFAALGKSLCIYRLQLPLAGADLEQTMHSFEWLEMLQSYCHIRTANVTNRVDAAMNLSKPTCLILKRIRIRSPRLFVRDAEYS